MNSRDNSLASACVRSAKTRTEWTRLQTLRAKRLDLSLAPFKSISVRVEYYIRVFMQTCKAVRMLSATPAACWRYRLGAV